MKIISGSSHSQLATNIAHKLKVDLIECDIKQFRNHEKRIWVKDNVRSENVTIVQAFNEPVDSHIIETLLMADALQRAGARHVNLIVPWLAYSLQDKVFRSGEPISAKVIANILSQSYIKRAFLLDLHNSSIPGFFSIPTEYLSAMNVFIQYTKQKNNLSDCVVASPDFGGLKKAREFSNILDLDLVNIEKSRNRKSGEVTIHDIHGRIKNKHILIYDDVIMSGGTLIEASKILKQKGASKVTCFATHGIFCSNAIEKIEKSDIDEIIITNSVPQKKNKKITVLDIADTFAQALVKWL